jgi:hypothetical protein
MRDARALRRTHQYIKPPEMAILSSWFDDPIIQLVCTCREGNHEESGGDAMEHGIHWPAAVAYMLTQ